MQYGIVWSFPIIKTWIGFHPLTTIHIMLSAYYPCNGSQWKIFSTKWHRSNNTKMDSNPIDSKLHLINEYMNDSSSITYNWRKQSNHLKISGCRIISTSDLFSLKKYQEVINLSHGTIIEGIIIGIPPRHSDCLTILWKNHNVEIVLECLWTRVMKRECDYESFSYSSKKWICPVLTWDKVIGKNWINKIYWNKLQRLQQSKKRSYREDVFGNQ